jgi:hypothetical protein
MGNGAWFGDYTISRAGESNIFTNFDANNAVMLTAKPIDGLSVYALLNKITKYGAKTKNTVTPDQPAELVWENIQFAAAYAIPDIGLVRAQYVGAHPGDNSNGKFELAFAYTGMEGLTVDVGGKFMLPFEDVDPVVKGKYTPGAEAALGAKYAAGPLYNRRCESW